MSSTNLTLNNGLGLRGMSGLLIVFASFNSFCHALTSPSSSTQATASQGSLNKGKVTEGREAVSFSSDTRVKQNDKDTNRLSDQFIAYPVEPVERLRPLFELGDPFLGNGPIRPGLKTPTGQMLQPWFLLYGSFRSALQSFEQDNQRTSEWTNRLDLNGNLNLSGTERVLFSMRPLDSPSGNTTGYHFEPNTTNGWQEDFNARLTKLYFEGDLGELVPGLDPNDSHTYDIGFSVGRQRLQLQDGMLINDNIDMVGFTRNSLVFDGISNLRITGLYGWNHLNRGSNEQPPSTHYQAADLFGLVSEADTAWNNTVTLDVVYVRDHHEESAWYVGASSTQRFGGLNSTFRVNASLPEHQESTTVGRGVLLLSQLSTTLPQTDNLLYFNTFWNSDRFTSAARGPDQGSPVANLGILYGPVGMGRYGVPLGHSIDHTLGAAIGYQMFLDGIDKQLIIEASARTSTQSGRDESAIGFGARYQQVIGKRHVLRLDASVAGREKEDLSYGIRTEWMIKF